MVNAYTLLSTLPDLSPEVSLQYTASQITGKSMEEIESQHTVFVCTDKEHKLSWVLSDNFAQQILRDE